ncbi:MAG: 1,4-dihydroxy-6-naphthoate synthase [Saprospiraceae bacterium]|nr:1,4-dihydroxy-6-naphthoate synthase [Saprospiraceae bacterium]
MKLTLSFSPCPNDTFIFEPIVNRRIDTGDLEFETTLNDVEQLNKAAFSGLPDVTKLSFNAFTRLYDQYQMLNSGSALGRNCGPLLITLPEKMDSEVRKLRIAIPGYYTTAFLLLKYAFPKAEFFMETIFSDIENAVLEGRADAGVIIHENRFTFESKGLVKILDLGEHWESKTGSPIPLGGIAVKRSLPDHIKSKIDSIMAQSVRYAFSHPQSGLEYIREHAQEMDDKVMYAHINLYVNEFTKSFGTEGKNAVITLFRTVYPDFSDMESQDLFVTP